MEPQINHVSVHAHDLQESVSFYVELLEAEPIPTPNFGHPVQWLALGRTQLHVFERNVSAPVYHHLGITVEDIERPYAVAARRGALDSDRGGHHLIELPGDVVQLYIRDPAGNLVELDMHGADRLSPTLRAELRALADLYPQSEDNLRGRLFVPAHALDRP